MPGLKFDPDNKDLLEIRGNSRVEVYSAELTNTFENAINLDISDIRRKLGAMESADSSRYSAFRQQAIRDLTDRINAIKDSDPNTAANLAQNAAEIFPGTALDQLKENLKPQPWPDAAIASAAVAAGEFSRALEIQQSSAADFTGHPEFIAFSEKLAEQLAEAKAAFEAYLDARDAAGNNYDDLRKTERLLRRAQAMWTDNVDYQQAETELDELIAANKPVRKPKVIAREDTDFSAPTVAAAAAPWK